MRLAHLGTARKGGVIYDLGMYQIIYTLPGVKVHQRYRYRHQCSIIGVDVPLLYHGRTTDGLYGRTLRTDWLWTENRTTNYKPSMLRTIPFLTLR